MVRFEDIERKVERYHPDIDLDLLRRAYIYTAMQLKDQALESGEPYLTFPMNVADVLAGLRLDSYCVAAGFLHTVLGSSLVTLDDIDNHFGQDIARIVGRASRTIELSDKLNYEDYAEMVLSTVEDVRITLVILANRLSVLRRLQFLKPRKREEIARQTLVVHIPIAHRLGQPRIREEMEEISYQHTKYRPNEETNFLDQNFTGPELIGLVLIGNKLKLASLRRDGTYKFLDEFENLHNIIHVTSETTAYQLAIEELESLVNNPNIKEQAFQDFFERNPDFILNDNYKKAHPHIVLSKNEEESLIPDFILEPVDQHSLCDLLELKLPSAPVFILKKSRMRFSAAVLEGRAQLLEYRRFFDEGKNREAILNRHGLTAYKPKMILIIGRLGHITPIDKRKIEITEMDIHVQTYDDIIKKMKTKIDRMKRGKFRPY